MVPSRALVNRSSVRTFASSSPVDVDGEGENRFIDNHEVEKHQDRLKQYSKVLDEAQMYLFMNASLTCLQH